MRIKYQVLSFFPHRSNFIVLQLHKSGLYSSIWEVEVVSRADFINILRQIR